LIDLVRRTTDAERDAARTHLIELFGAVGNEDPRVIRARRDLASALF
jgi:putative thioredoxin